MATLLTALARFGRKGFKVFSGDEQVEESKEVEEFEDPLPPVNPHANKLHPKVFWKPKSPLTYGEPLTEEHLNAFCKDYKTRFVEGYFVYNPPLGTILDAGIQTLTAQFIPAKTWRYLSAEGSADLQVKKNTPVVTWDFPFKEILFGTLLGDEFFNVQCELKGGSFYFSHDKDSLLEIGKHTLKAEYQPSSEEAVNYSRGYCSVLIRVVGAPCPLKWDIPYSQSAHTEVLKAKAPAQAPELSTLTNEDGSSDNENEKKMEFSGRRGRRGGISSASAKQSEKAAGNFIDAAKALPDYKRSSAFCEGAPLIYPDPMPDWISNAECTDPSITGTFVYDPPVRTVLPAGRHTITAHFHPDDRRRYRVSSESRVVQVLRSPVPLDWPTAVGMTEGEVLDASALNCTSHLNIPGTYTYEPTFGTALTEGEYTLNVKFEPEDTRNYLSATASMPYRVRPKKIPQLHYPQPPSIVHPFPLNKLQLNASVRGGGYFRGSWEYNPPFGTILPAGTHTITATFIPDRPTVRVTSISVQLEVEQGMSRLVWNTPAPLIEGQGLYDDSLNCFCSNLKGGKFSYKPPKGTVLPVGKHRLRCHYKPSSPNYMEAFAFVNVMVLPRPQSKYETIQR